MLLKDYDFKDIEQEYNYLWSEEEMYKYSYGLKNNFVIDTPPPTISGNLHMGHVFSYCHTDFIARYKRMLGKNVFYPMGFDDNGLPTERLVEKIKKIRASNTSRAEFIGMCNEVSFELRLKFKGLFQSIGISCDWNLEYNTVSQNIQKLSQASFVKLYREGRIYRKLEPILWDVVDQTAISHAEVEDREFISSMNVIRFTLEDGQSVDIATTRPELLPACVAVFCNPNDARYYSIVGKNIIVPIFKTKVKVLSDDKVKIEKGTGLVMCCTFGDEMDVHWWKKYRLDTKIIINKRGRLCNLGDLKFENEASELFSQLENLSVIAAREFMREVLFKKNLLISSESIVHNVKCAERSGSVLEILPNDQWFVKTFDQKDDLLKKVKEIDWHPKSMCKRMEIWINDLNWDWCISRQRYFGVPIPIWYSKRSGEEGKVLIPKMDQLPVDPLKDLPCGYDIGEVIPDIDVMDTWATSSMSPFFYSDISDQYSEWSPCDLRAQSHEIIRTWAFYTILRSYYHENSIPWKNIMISGWCLADNKKKMSKSKGNIVAPQSIINSYGADAVRYWAANSRLGVDTVFSEDVLKIGKRLTLKLWNSGRFVSQFISKYKEFDYSKITEGLDLWILSKLYKLVEGVTSNFEAFEYCLALTEVEKFFWQDFCDNYLELVKRRIYDESLINLQKKVSAINTISYVFQKVLFLFAPFLPYITDKIYRTLYADSSIHCNGTWPELKQEFFSQEAEVMGGRCVEILNQVRKIKSHDKRSIKSSIKRLTIFYQIKDEILPDSIVDDLKSACNADIAVWNHDKNALSQLANGDFSVDIEYFS